MPKYIVSFYTMTDSIERSYEAANADECLDHACIDFALSGEPQDRLDEIVVRPGNADDRVQRSDGSSCIELYWTTPQFRRRQQKEIAAMADADLAAASKILSECGTYLSQSPLAREYLRRKFPLR